MKPHPNHTHPHGRYAHEKFSLRSETLCSSLRSRHEPHVHVLHMIHDICPFPVSSSGSLSTYHHVSDSSSNIQDRCCAYILVAMSAVEHKDVRNFEDLLQRHSLREEEHVLTGVAIGTCGCDTIAPPQMMIWFWSQKVFTCTNLWPLLPTSLYGASCHEVRFFWWPQLGVIQHRIFPSPRQKSCMKPCIYLPQCLSVAVERRTLFRCWGEWRASHWQPGLEDLF